MSFYKSGMEFDRKCSTPRPNVSLRNVLENEIPKRDLREEMILYFYSSMLEHITEKKELRIEESVQSIPSAERVLIGHPSYEKSVVEEEVEIPPRHCLIKEPSDLMKSSTESKLCFKKRRKKTVKIPLKMKGQSNTNYFLKKKDSFVRTNNWVWDDIEGNVRIQFINGNTYEGTTYCNMLHGQGKFTWLNGTVYEGEFKKNEITGRGRFQFPNQSTYSGEVYKNYCHGFGLLFPSKSLCVYKGNFYFNVKQGFGWQIFSNNNSYEGEWYDNNMNGEGHRKYPSGAEYCGKFMLGKRHGYGVAVMKNQDVYSGEWVQGDMHGFGDYIWNVQNEHYFSAPVQSSYHGMWANNKRNGIGVINFGMEGGSRYAGYFVNNEKHGSGVIICENGHVLESNPLFINDKPAHVKDSGNLDNLQPADSTSEICLHEEEAPKSSVKFRFDSINECLGKDGRQGKEDRSSIDESITIKQNKDNSDVYHQTFPKVRDQYSSLKIPIGVSCELIDLNSYIYKIIEFKSSLIKTCKIKEENESGLVSSKFVPSSVETYSDYELHTFEEKLIRKSISKYLHELKRIYNLYAKIGCIEQQTTFKPWLMRIFFWQLYRDCKIPEKGMSLIEIDLMFSEKSTFNCDVHNPFEILYFWQYLESLLHVALALYGDVFVYGDGGILKQSFEYFMENDILPNAGHFRGSALFEYRDVLPMKATYAWYKTFGEPHTVKQLYSNIYTLGKKRRAGRGHDVLSLPNIRIGRNVINCGDKILYLEDDDCIICDTPLKESIKSIKWENANKLHFLANVKRHTILKNIYSVCPWIKDNIDIYNFEYELSFLEFYEIILNCIEDKVNMKSKASKTNTILTEKKSSIKIVHIPIKEKKIAFPRKSKKAQG